MPFNKNDPANIECPCCHGQGWLLVHEQLPLTTDDRGHLEPMIMPSHKAYCCHCSGSGVIPPDMRSDNAYE